jgi:hypothetical protein
LTIDDLGKDGKGQCFVGLVDGVDLADGMDAVDFEKKGTLRAQRKLESATVGVPTVERGNYVGHDCGGAGWAECRGV